MPAIPTARLAWQTPTGAILWELWARQKWKFMFQAIALLVSAVLAQWLDESQRKSDSLGPIAYQAGVLAVLHALGCFCYLEMDARRFQGGIPGHLLLKPLTTTRLVAVPMLCGGAVVAAVFLAWAELVWRPFGFPATLFDWLPWILGACLVGKLLGSAAAFNLGLRRKTVTRAAIGWIIAAWLASGLFVAVIARSVCARFAAPQL